MTGGKIGQAHTEGLEIIENNIAQAFQEKGACRGVKTHGAAWHSESCRFVNIPSKGCYQRGFMAENETVMELYRKFNAANLIHSLFRQYSNTQEGRHRTVKELDQTLLPVHSSIFHLKDAEKICSKGLHQEITEKSGNLTKLLLIQEQTEAIKQLPNGEQRPQNRPGGYEVAPS